MRTAASRLATTALVVSPDPGLRDHVGAWLEEDGWDVVMCPGPGPGFHRGCIGLRGMPCPLERAAGLVILDLAPEGEHLIDRSLRPELVELYRGRGKNVLVLVDEPWGMPAPEVGGVAFGDRLSPRAALMATVRELAQAT